MSEQYVVVVPVKPPTLGKSRLQGLSDALRRELAAAFALDTATACLDSRRVAQVLVATDDAFFAARLAAIGCATIPDGDSSGLNAALRQAVADAHRRWPGLVPVALCADLPALRAADLDEALGALVPGGPSFVADAEGTGTTMYTAPYDEFDPQFGLGSAAAHAAAGALPVRGDLIGLRHDVDDLDGLHRAIEIGVGAATAALVDQLP